jgi:hypothetical protein
LAAKLGSQIAAKNLKAPIAKESNHPGNNEVLDHMGAARVSSESLNRRHGYTGFLG